MIKFLVVQIITAALFFVAWMQGWPQYLYTTDITHLTLVIAAISVMGVIFVASGHERAVDIIIEGLPKYGLFGTMVGLVMVASAVGHDVQGMVDGMATAFNTTIVGLIGSEWVRLTQEFVRNETA